MHPGAIPSARLSLGARIWLANPTGEQASVLVSVIKSGFVVNAQQLEIPPHAGMIWLEGDTGLRAGLTVIVSVRKGVVASGPR